MDSVAPETPIRVIVDRCRVWESHADSDNRKGRRPGPERALPIYMVDDAGGGRDDQPVAAVTTSPTAPGAVGIVASMAVTDTSGAATGPHTGTFVVGSIATATAGGPQIREHSRAPDAGTGLQCCVSHVDKQVMGRATRYPTLDVSFAFMLSEWREEKAGCGYVMISPRVVAERRRAESGD